MSLIKEVTIYTDGGCNPNPGVGGYGVVMMFGGQKKELSGGFRRTTNNRMELYAAFAGLQALKEPCRVKLYSDSQYLVQAMQLNWVARWQSKRWKDVKNPDLWQKIIALSQQHQVEFIWVKGHAGDIYNERCDQLATLALNVPNLPIDEAYERTESETAPRALTTAAAEKAPTSGKITREGQPCRDCSTPVIKKTPRRKNLKAGQSYFYTYYLSCPQCQKMYLTDDAKQAVPETMH